MKLSHFYRFILFRLTGASLLFVVFGLITSLWRADLLGLKTAGYVASS